ncbi:helix-turn-helix domain-containing protein [Parvularcula oceani]|uniref:helix-turn-helix domain-containing protein n=1 Tax=Parvularcula oceani TaxID=1247963 RepID=UPI00068A33F3|nr:helix-turn-helix transcriptional regulator [Parvularcula oceani]
MLHSVPDVEEGATIGQRIRAARKALGLNQGALADRLGVTQPTVANWEAGVHDPRQLMLAKLSEALSVSLGWLAGGERSELEADRSAAAPYLRRPMQHVPVLTAASAARVVRQNIDPHRAATDYIPITYGGGELIAVFLPKTAVPGDIAPDTLFVIDMARKAPLPGELVILRTDTGLLASAWERTPGAAGGGNILGTVVASIRFH